MIYAESFKNSYPHIIEFLTLCSKLHSDPMIYTDIAGNPVGCNKQLAELLEALRELRVAVVLRKGLIQG